MGFKMVCPKCGSLNYSVERDGRSYIRTGPSSELIFSCRCGKQLFGDQLSTEFDRQRAIYEADAAERVADERKREADAAAAAEQSEKMRKALEFRQNYLREKRAQEEEQARVAKAEADREWRQRVAATGADPVPPPAHNVASNAEAAVSPSDEEAPRNPPGTPANKGPHLCGWGPCVNDARHNSKYCSRACSNKNARWRHKKRKK